MQSLLLDSAMMPHQGIFIKCRRTQNGLQIGTELGRQCCTVMVDKIYSAPERSVFSIFHYYSSIAARQNRPLMIKRCMTPNPHSKSKYLSELVEGCSLARKQAQKISYDSFLYMDKLNNRQIAVGDIKNLYLQKSKRNIHTANPTAIKNSRRMAHPAANKGKQYSQTRQIEEIEECLTLMRSTKLFEMENLKNKIFVKSDSSTNKENQEIESLIKKKKKLREFIEQYLDSLSLNQFRKYMEPEAQDKSKVKFISPNILNLHKNISHKINKQNVEKIIDEIIQSDQAEKAKKPPIDISLDDIKFPDQQRLKKLLMYHMFIKNKGFEYLITPSHAKRMTSQVVSRAYSRAKLSQTAREAPMGEDISQYRFNQFQEGQLPDFTVKQYKKRPQIDAKLLMRHKQILLAIETGSVYDFLFLVIRWPGLLRLRDQLGNTLLHAAAKFDQGEIYTLLVQRMGLETLRHKNNCGKTPIDQAKLFGSHQVQKLNLALQNQL